MGLLRLNEIAAQFGVSDEIQQLFLRVNLDRATKQENYPWEPLWPAEFVLSWLAACVDLTLSKTGTEEQLLFAFGVKPGWLGQLVIDGAIEKHGQLYDVEQVLRVLRADPQQKKRHHGAVGPNEFRMFTSSDFIGLGR